MGGGWIGQVRTGTAADRAVDAPALVVSAAHSAFGAVRHLQIRVGEVAVLLHSAPPPLDGDRAAGPRTVAPAGPEVWVRDDVREELDLGAHLAAELDLADREAEGMAGPRWSGTLSMPSYAALRRADPAEAEAVATAAGCPAGLVRALAEPVAVSRVEVIRRAGADLATGPTAVVTDELAWVDGGDAGLWTVRPEDAGAVRIARGTPAEVADELAGMVRAAEGC